MEHPGGTTEAAHLGWIYLLILHFLHGFLHFLELLHHTVDVLDLHASAVSDTLSAAAVQNLDIRSFPGVMERMIASMCLTSLPSRSTSFS